MSLQINPLPVIILTLVAATASFYPQETRGQSGGVDIRGIGTDSTNGERLPGVNIVLVSRVIESSEIIKSVEIYTGPFPAKHGDRLSSVVNVITRDREIDILP